MKNKLIVALFATALICTACGQVTTENQTGKTVTKITEAESQEINGKDEQQFRIMSEKIEKAFDSSPEDYSEDFPYQYYTITDLNQNGRLELIISSGMIGSGLFTYSQIYEVNADGTKLKNYTQNSDFMSDIVNGIDTAYYNKKTNTYYYVTEDFIRNGATESGTDVMVFSLKDGKIISDCIAYQHAWHDFDTDKAIVEYCKYVNGKKKKLTAKEYNPKKIEKEYFKGMEKKKVKIHWSKFKKKSKEEKIVELLKETYKKFELN